MGSVKIQRMWLGLLMVLTPLMPVPASAETNQLITYQGRILRPDGTPVSGNITFTVKVLSPTPSACLLWGETQTVAMSLGVFSLQIGRNANRLTGANGGAVGNFNQAFINNPALVTSGATCDNGSTYTPALADDRNLVVSFVDNGTSIKVADQAIKAVPFAMQAEQVGGYSINYLFKIAGTGQAGDKTSGLFTTAGMNLLWELAQNQDFQGNVLKNIGAPTTGTDAANKAYVDSVVSAGGTTGIGAITGTAPILIASSGVNRTISLGTSGVAAASYGTSLMVPQLTIDSFGRITVASTAAIPLATASTVGLVSVNTSSGLTIAGGTLGLGTIDAGSLTGTLGVAHGGTGLGALTPNALLMANGTGTAVQSMVCSSEQVLVWKVSGGWTCEAKATGAVSSVDLFAPSLFTVSGNPVTGNGTLGLTLNSQSANTFFAAPAGTTGTPIFRGLASSDLPVGSANTIYGINAAGTAAEFKTLVGGSGLTVANTAGTITLSVGTTGQSQWSNVASGINYASGSVGIGNASPAYRLDVVVAPTTTSGEITGAIKTATNVQPASAVSAGANAYGETHFVNNLSTADLTNLTSTAESYTNQLLGGSNMLNMIGVQGSTIHGGTGTLTQAVGYQPIVNNSGSGTITTARGISIAVTNTGTGTIGTAIGLYVGNIQGSTTYGMFQGDGTAKNYFAGKIGIGTSSPTVGLDVATTGPFASAIRIPQDTTANRPTGGVGMMRYNTDLSAYEVYATTGWATLSSGTSSASPWANAANGISYVAGSVGIGVANPGSALDVLGNINLAGAITPGGGVYSAGPVQAQLAGAGVYPQVIASAISTSGSGQFLMQRARGTSAASPISVNDTDWIGNVTGRAYTTQYNDAIWMQFAVDGTNVTGSGNFPGGRADFITRGPADSAQYTVSRSVMTIRNNGNVGIGVTSPTAGLDIATVGTLGSAIRIPRDTTANRPTSSGVGMMRYNTDLAAYEVYYSTGWTTLATGAGTAAASQWVSGTTGISYVAGSVGIGVANPQNALDIVGNTQISSTGATLASGIFLLNPSALAADRGTSVKFRAATSIDIGQVGAAFSDTTGTASYLTFINRSAGALSEKMRIDTVGKVGIGTTTPTAGLDIATLGTLASAIRIPRDTTANRPSAAGNGMMRYNSTNNKFEAYENGQWANMISGTGSSQWTLAPNGTDIYTQSPIWVAINAPAGTDPLTPLDVYGQSTYHDWADFINGLSVGDGTTWYATYTGSYAGGFAGATVNLNAGGGNVYERAAGKLGFQRTLSGSNNYSLIFNTNAGDESSAYVDVALVSNGGDSFIRSGRLGVGTASPTANLHVNDTTTTGSQNMLLVTQGSLASGSANSIALGKSASLGGFMTYTHDTTAANRRLGIGLLGSAEAITIASGGSIGIGVTAPVAKLDVGTGSVNAAAYLNSSDRRLKTNIQPVAGLANILRLNGKTFNWRASGKDDVGLIAQEVEEVFPQLVSTSAAGFKSVQYTNLVAPLIEATKELYGMCKASDAQLAQLAADVQTHSRDIASLKSENEDLKKRVERLENLVQKLVDEKTK